MLLRELVVGKTLVTRLSRSLQLTMVATLVSAIRPGQNTRFRTTVLTEAQKNFADEYVVWIIVKQLFHAERFEDLETKSVQWSFGVDFKLQVWRV